MRFGWYISAGGHVSLILAVLLGGFFAGEHIPEPVVLSEVSLLSEEDFAALTPPETAPDTQSNAPDVAAPDEDASPETPEDQAAPALPASPPIETPDSPDAPDFEVEQLLPNAVVVDEAPTVPAPPTDQDGTSLEPDQVAAPAPRVAPVPQVAPPPDVETGPELIEDTALAPDAPPKEVVEDTPAAPEQASDRIVTEAEEQDTAAVVSSKRPRTRPARPRPAAEDAPASDPETPTATDTTSTDDAVAAALADNDAPSETPVQRGPPLTGGERDAFRLAVGQCWRVDTGGRTADVKVTIRFELDRSGRVVDNQVELVRAEGGDAAAQRSAYDNARRAILRCSNAAGGYNLPADKFDQWRVIEATFNPQGMQFR